MRCERAREYLERRMKDKTVTYASALEAIRIVEDEAEEALQALRDKFAADIKQLVNKWDISDQKIDRLWLKEIEAYKAEIEKYKREISELKQRLAIAEKVIADKNKESRQ